MVPPQVAQIITYGTMAAKSSIRDAGRVLELPLSDTDRIAKLIPDMTKLKKIWALDDKEIKSKFSSDEANLVKHLKELAEGEGKEAMTIQQARVLEGSVRNTGIHACGVIITPSDIRELVLLLVQKTARCGVHNLTTLWWKKLVCSRWIS